MKKVFVTGGAGFIGSHLCHRLLEMGYSVSAYDNLSLGKREFLKDCEKSGQFQFFQKDLLDFDVLVKEIIGHDLVFHLAANSDILAGAQRTDIDLKQGTLVTYNVLEAMRVNRIPEIIFASTSAIYGEAQVKPTPENYGPLQPISLYGASKLACEALITAFCHNFKMKGWIYRFANIVGSHATHGAIYDFVGRLKKNPGELTVLGNGTQKKSYLHVSDCVEGMLHGYNAQKNESQIFNLASHGTTEVRFMAEEVVRQMGGRAHIKFGTEDRGWVGDVPFTWLDGKCLEGLGWKASLNSNESVQKAVAEIISESGALK